MVEGARLEIVYAVKRIGGSNPPLSASNGQISRSSPARAAFSLLSRSVSKEKRALAHSVSEKKFHFGAILQPRSNLFCHEMRAI